jgi:uncharacterized protein involved in type VI secretion and phage assembly
MPSLVAQKKFLGKFRGTVVDNIDPLQMGRIQAIVPDVSNVVPTSWAVPCVPVGGIQMGFYSVPPIGSGVWIEFEQGDPDYPIWVGSFWGSAAEVPALAHAVPPEVPLFVMQTTLQNGLLISDLPGPTGGIVLKSSTGASIIVNDTGIYLSNGKGATVTMLGNIVSINGTALTVM